VVRDDARTLPVLYGRNTSDLLRGSRTLGEEIERAEFSGVPEREPESHDSSNTRAGEMDGQTAEGTCAMSVYFPIECFKPPKSGWGILSMGRGKYMETPLGIKPDGSIKWLWGRLLAYGCGRGRTGWIARSDYLAGKGESFHYSVQSLAPFLPPTVGEHAKRCAWDGKPFISTRSDALACSARCKKALQRDRKRSVPFNTKGERERKKPCS
jgi:hypothetical protein